MITKQDLRSLIGASKNELRVREVAEARTEQAAQVVRLKRGELRRRIWAGESTGDRFVDYALMSSGRFSDSKVERYRELDSELSKHPKQLVLLSWYDKDDTALLCVKSPLSYIGEFLPGRRHFVYVGIHMGEGLSLRVGDDERPASCSILVKHGYARAWSGQAKADFFNANSFGGPRSRKGRSHLAEEQPFRLFDKSHSEDSQSLDECEVVIGDDEVVDWLEENDSLEFLAFVRRRLKKPDVRLIG